MTNDPFAAKDTGNQILLPSASLLNPMAVDMMTKASILIVERREWIYYIGIKHIEAASGVEAGSLLTNYSSTKTIMDLPCLARQISMMPMAKRTIPRAPPRVVVFVGYNMRNYWQIDLLTCELTQICLAQACDLVLGAEQAKCFHIARWNQFRHCFIVPCMLLIPEPSIELGKDRVTRLQARGKEGMWNFSTVLRSRSVEPAPAEHTLFYVRARPEIDVSGLEEQPEPAGRRIFSVI